ncbi:hypothetical protein [Neorhizobium sp. DAR64872/K0K18]|uniref:hypothetical protein n=1 Tax=Neorhizobium sp. DAR64872/K0K18 TaxID=3421958 RepID=UPI003D2D5C6D
MSSVNMSRFLPRLRRSLATAIYPEATEQLAELRKKPRYKLVAKRLLTRSLGQPSNAQIEDYAKLFSEGGGVEIARGISRVFEGHLTLPEYKTALDSATKQNAELSSELAATRDEIAALSLELREKKNMQTTVAVLFRGPLRPNALSTLSHIGALREHLITLGLAPVTYLATWKPNDPHELNIIMQAGLVDNLIALDPYPDEAMPQETLDARQGTMRNAFRQFYLSHCALSVIAKDPRHAYIVHSRTDLDIEMRSRADWFNGRYCTPHVRTSLEGTFVNDQFAVAPPAMMAKAWDYGTIENLSAMIARASKPEDVLQYILDDANITAVETPFVKCLLNSARHSA